MKASRGRVFVAELVGTAALTCVVVASGRMATNLTDDRAVQLLLNDGATIAALGLLVWLLAPISGAHLNPVVTLVMHHRGTLNGRTATGFVAAQISGAIGGTWVANVLYAQAPISISETARGGLGQLLAEVIATAGLLVVICVALDRRANSFIAVLVPAWIGSAYLFTSSTSFANPAVTVGRIFSDSFAGISPASVPAFIGAQLAGATLGVVIARSLTVGTKESQHV